MYGFDQRKRYPISNKTQNKKNRTNSLCDQSSISSSDFLPDDSKMIAEVSQKSQGGYLLVLNFLISFNVIVPFHRLFDECLIPFARSSIGSSLAKMCCFKMLSYQTIKIRKSCSQKNNALNLTSQKISVHIDKQ